MAFSARRGRPAKPRPDTVDFGTPELRLKHALGVTAEPIDLCLARSLITEAQHRAGLHLRWLYTLRYGAPSLTTQYMQSQQGFVEDDTDWRHSREREYLEASRLLKAHQRYEPVMRLAVFNERPLCLTVTQRPVHLPTPARVEAVNDSWQKLTQGLELLIELWGSPNRKNAPATMPQLRDLTKIVP